jgi:hypothetical protein
LVTRFMHASSRNVTYCRESIRNANEIGLAFAGMRPLVAGRRRKKRAEGLVEEAANQQSELD